MGVVTPSSLETARLFEGTYRLHLQGRRVSPARNQQSRPQAERNAHGKSDLSQASSSLKRTHNQLTACPFQGPIRISFSLIPLFRSGSPYRQRSPIGSPKVPSTPGLAHVIPGFPVAFCPTCSAYLFLRLLFVPTDVRTL